MKSKMLAHRIGKRRAIRIGILTQKTTDQLDGVLLGQGAFDLVLNFHGATINAARKNVQRYLWAMGRAGHFRSSAEERVAKYPILGNGCSAKLGRQMRDFNVQGAAGNAAVATAAKGHALLYAAGLQLTQLLLEVTDVPLSTLLLLWTRLSLA